MKHLSFCRVSMLAVALWHFAGSCSAGEIAVSPFIQRNAPWSADGTLLLELSTVREPKKSFDTAIVELKATNAAQHPIRLDKELIVGFRLSFRTDLEHDAANDDGPNTDEWEVRWIDTKPVKPDRFAAQERFVMLGPGESLKRRIDFSNRITNAGTGRDWFKTRDGSFVHNETFGESTSELGFPEQARQLEIRLMYETDFAPSLFERWFGVHDRIHRVWWGTAGSAPLIIKIREDSPNQGMHTEDSTRRSGSGCLFARPQ